MTSDSSEPSAASPTGPSPGNAGGTAVDRPDGRGRVPWGIWIFLALWFAVAVWVLIEAEPPWQTAVQLAQDEADGKRPQWSTQAAPGIWLAAAIAGVLSLILSMTARWWAVGLGSGDSQCPGVDQGTGLSRTKSRAAGARWFWIGLLLIVAAGSAARLPLASKSMWWDELWAVNKVSHGEWRPDRDNPGEVRFHPTSWDRAAWYFLKPTNHPTATLAQKASLDTWRAVTGARRYEFNDLAARMPSLIASAAAVAAVGVLLCAWGMPVAGLLAAGLLALHPWAIRYGVDARAYALVLPLVPLGLLWLTELHRQPWRWRWWWLLAANQFLLLWTFPNAIPMALGLFFAAALALWHRLRSSGGLIQAWSRLVAVHVVAAMAFFHAFLPNLMQVFHWGDDPQPLLGWERLRETAMALALGVSYGSSEVGSPLVQWSTLLDGSWWATGWLWLHVAMLALGAWALLHRSRVGFSGIGLILGFAALYVAVSWWREIYFYPRYLVYLLPLLVILVAIGWTQGAAWLARQVRTPVTPVAAAVAAFALAWFAALTWPQLQVLWQRPLAPQRDSVEFIRSQPGSEDALIIAYGQRGRVTDAYGQRGRPGAPASGRETAVVDLVMAGDRSSVETALEMAAENERPLWLLLGSEGFDRRHSPGGFELIDDPQWFEFVAEFQGTEEAARFLIYRAVER